MSIEREHWLKKAEDLAARGQRVLALARRAVPTAHTVLTFADLDDSLTLLGLVGMIDPP